MNKRIVSRVSAMVLAATMMLSGLTVCAATPKSAKSAAQTSSVSAGMSKADKAMAKYIMNCYLNGEYNWCGDDGVSQYISYFYTARPEFNSPAAPGPVFAVADLDADGRKELYTYPGIGSTWTCYVLNNGEATSTNASGFSAAAGAWVDVSFKGISVIGLGSNGTSCYFGEIMNIAYTGTDTAQLELDGATAPIPLATAQAYAAAFPTLGTYLSAIAQPVNATTVNAAFK